MAPHSSALAWKVPWTEEPGGLQSMGSRWVGHDWATSLSLFTFMRWRRKWQPTPVFLPGESQGWGRLVGCRLWGCTESDTTEATWQQQLHTQWPLWVHWTHLDNLGYSPCFEISWLAIFSICNFNFPLLWNVTYLQAPGIRTGGQRGHYSVYHRQWSQKEQHHTHQQQSTLSSLPASLLTVSKCPKRRDNKKP